MSFVFVCLVGDEAARDASAFAARLAARLGSHRFIEGESPDHMEIVRAVQEAPAPVGILFFGHDGGALRSRSSEDPAATDWATSQRLAELFPDATVYAFACDSMGHGQQEDLEALGHAAVRGGIASFLGHCCVVSAAVAEDPDPVVDAFAATLMAYFAGERGVVSLRQKLEDSFDALDAIETSGLAALFSTSIALRSAVRGLRLASR